MLTLVPQYRGGPSNSRIRDECLNINVFWSLTQARVSSTSGNTTTTATAAIPAWATNRRPATLPLVPTTERLSLAVDQFLGSGHDPNDKE
jgi:hypothetical protein